MKRIVRKTIVFVISGIMLVAMAAIPVFASSPVADNVSIPNLPKDVILTVIDIKTPETATAAAKEIGLPAEFYVCGLYEIYTTPVVADGAYEVSIIMSLAGMTDPVTVYRKVNNEWVALPTSYANNTVKFTTPNFSNFAVVAKLDSGTVVTDTTTSSGSGGTTPVGKSPKTEGSAMGLSELLVIIMMLGAIGAFYSYRRSLNAGK